MKASAFSVVTHEKKSTIVFILCFQNLNSFLAFRTARKNLTLQSFFFAALLVSSKIE